MGRPTTSPSPGPAGTRARRRFLGLALGLLVTSSCSNISVQVDKASRMDLAGFGTYAFMESSDYEELASRIEDAVDAEMASIGLTRVERDEARLLVAYDTLVEVGTRYIDPFERAFYSHERYEEGTLVLEMIDASDDEVVWSGTAQSQLRVIARGYGVSSVRYDPTDEAREWAVEEKIQRLLKRFPRK